ncbi:MAG: 5-(carboxyamino)imidazole ribonucleotide mutase [Methanobacteriaceae archaeon]|nr:5-(carboxyamino)imidazole ribonucleotide mutase [Methanobacteriaceae archaeon]
MSGIQPKIMIIMGSASDKVIAQKTIKVLDEMKIAYDLKVASAHRTHERVKHIVKTHSNIDVFIAIAGLAAHLPGVIASFTDKPVIAVPVDVKFDGLDALVSSVQMVKGVPIATMGVDRGDNAAWLACEILAVYDKSLQDKLVVKRESYNQKIENSQIELIEDIATDSYKFSTEIDEYSDEIKDVNIPKDVEVVVLVEEDTDNKLVDSLATKLNLLGLNYLLEKVSLTNPDLISAYMKSQESVKVYIAVSGLSTVLIGAVVAHTTKPVIGVPCSTKLNGLDSLLSAIQMPPGVPVATLGLDAVENAVIYAKKIIGK